MHTGSRINWLLKPVVRCWRPLLRSQIAAMSGGGVRAKEACKMDNGDLYRQMYSPSQNHMYLSVL